MLGSRSEILWKLQKTKNCCPNTPNGEYRLKNARGNVLTYLRDKRLSVTVAVNDEMQIHKLFAPSYHVMTPTFLFSLLFPHKNVASVICRPRFITRLLIFDFINEIKIWTNVKVSILKLNENFPQLYEFWYGIFINITFRMVTSLTY